MGLQVEGLVLEAAEDWAQVFVPKYGIEKRVYFNDDPRLQAVDFDDATGTAAVNWAEEEQTGVERLVPLQRVLVLLSARGTPLDCASRMVSSVATKGLANTRPVLQT